MINKEKIESIMFEIFAAGFSMSSERYNGKFARCWKDTNLDVVSHLRKCFEEYMEEVVTREVHLLSDEKNPLVNYGDKK